MAELKPCPFCGGTAGFSQLKQGKFNQFSVVCFNARCFASTKSCFGRYYRTKDEAAEAWNRRADNG